MLWIAVSSTKLINSKDTEISYQLEITEITQMKCLFSHSYAVPWALVVLLWFANCQYNCLSTISQDLNPHMVAG